MDLPTLKQMALAKAAYESFGDQRSWRLPNGSLMPSWNELTYLQQVAWGVAAATVERLLPELAGESWD